MNATRDCSAPSLFYRRSVVIASLRLPHKSFLPGSQIRPCPLSLHLSRRWYAPTGTKRQGSQHVRTPLSQRCMLEQSSNIFGNATWQWEVHIKNGSFHQKSSINRGFPAKPCLISGGYSSDLFGFKHSHLLCTP